jgi:VCBS repeat-containing protein
VPTTTVTVPPTAVQFSDNSPIDLKLDILPPDEISIPSGWSTVPQNGQFEEVSFIDLQEGLELNVNVTGRPMMVNDVLAPIATVRLFWATSASDTGGAEIGVTSNDGPLGVFWNSDNMHAVINEFPAAPAGATHVRVLIDAVAGADADPLNSSTFLSIEDFAAEDPQTGGVSEDERIESATNSVLGSTDQADPNTRVLAFADFSTLGAPVQVLDEDGTYTYDPRQIASIQALAPAETLTDTISFLAAKFRAIADQAVLTITLVGLNDAPRAVDDSASTTNQRQIALLLSDLLNNDRDIDHNDFVTYHSVETTSELGATVTAILDAEQTAVVEIVYDPTTSSQLAELSAAESVEDSFSYEIMDTHDATDTARISVDVSFEEPLSIQPVATQFTIVDLAIDSIPLILTDPDGDASDLQLSAVSSDESVVDNDDLQLSGSGSARALAVQPLSGVDGRTWITVTAFDDGGRRATPQFPVIVGLEEDLDLDGVLNDEEDAAPNGGDMNNDGQPDKLQPDVASARAAVGDAFFNLIAADGHFLSNVSTKVNPDPSGVAADAQFLHGALAYEVVLKDASESSTVELRSKYGRRGVESIFSLSGIGCRRTVGKRDANLRRCDGLRRPRRDVRIRRWSCGRAQPVAR